MTSRPQSGVRRIDKADLKSQRRLSLSEQLHNLKSPVGRAFRTLCDAGCDSRSLENLLLILPKFPFGRAETLTSKDLKQFLGVVQDLESAVGRLERLPDRAFDFLPGDLLPENWSRLFTPPGMGDSDREEVTELLRMISTRLHNILNGPLRLSRSMAADFLPKVVKRIRESTNGKPYWKETATLIAAAYGIIISPEHLKQIARRTK